MSYVLVGRPPSRFQSPGETLGWSETDIRYAGWILLYQYWCAMSNVYMGLVRQQTGITNIASNEPWRRDGCIIMMRITTVTTTIMSIVAIVIVVTFITGSSFWVWSCE